MKQINVKRNKKEISFLEEKMLKEKISLKREYRGGKLICIKK
jgi:hypothetical protein